jgi:hypothetical protein
MAQLVSDYARMWPREIFDVMEEGRKKLFLRGRHDLDQPGVYILYRDEHPYYVGQAKSLYRRLHDHANKSTDRYFNFWNYFSAFVVPNPEQLDEVEGILIASMPTANRAVPRLHLIEFPPEAAKVLRSARRRRLGLDAR